MFMAVDESNTELRNHIQLVPPCPPPLPPPKLPLQVAMEAGHLVGGFKPGTYIQADMKLII